MSYYELTLLLRTREGNSGSKRKNRKYTDLPLTESAFYRLSQTQILAFSLGVIIFIVSLLFNWHATILIIIGGFTLFYFADMLFSFILIFRSFARNPEIKITDEALAKAEKLNHWPTYTILCPLYKEWQVLPQFVGAMANLDYPHDKLQILLLLEENDRKTLAKAYEMNLPKDMKIVTIPDSRPKTKPKALNYGLKMAKGEFLVIYDAEDVPEPLQLKKAILAFAKTNNDTVCVQAKLNFYNPRQNMLTRLFTAEYALWFDLILTGLQSISAPIPLGGTSNHFRTVYLRRLLGWDAYNVTEDCDLGIRIAERGYRTAIFDSVTLEEANSRVLNWFHQRTRWIKGYLQTYFVHMRHPGQYWQNGQKYNFAVFQLVVGGKTFTTLVNSFMWIVTIAYFLFRPQAGHLIESFFPGPIFYLAIFSLLAGNFIYIYAYMIGSLRREQYDLVKYAFLVPFYWAGMSLASWVALYEILIQPHYWAKTIHGFHLQKVNLPPAISPTTTAGAPY